MKVREIKIKVAEYDSFDELDKSDVELIKRAKKASQNAYAPYSDFKVGTALLLENNEIIEGSNQENAAYPSGLCAERVAMFYANSSHPDIGIKAIAVAVFSNNKIVAEPVPPCGACRQSLLESELRFNTPIKVILAGEEKVTIIDSVKSLLPLNFDHSNLTEK